MPMNNLVIVILSAGKGTRMKSDIPKVCHVVGDKTMIEHVVKTSKELVPNEIIIVVSKNNIEPIRKVLQDVDVRLKIQYKTLGTAHAVLSASPCCNEEKDLLVLLGDVPLITSETLRKIVITKYDAVVVGFKNQDITNKCGRIVIERNRITKIVEYNEANHIQRRIKLCNSGMLWIKGKYVPYLNYIENNNSKGEYYLTDIIKLMVSDGLTIGFLEAPMTECMGVNTQNDLKTVNNIYKKLNQI